MAKFEKRIQARKLRQKGESLAVIAQELGVSKSTVSLWCRDLELTQGQYNSLRKKQVSAGHKGRVLGAQQNRLKKIKRLQEAERIATKKVSRLSKRDRFMLGLGLYWGEGVKADQSPASFVNSDPASVVFMKQWFQEFFEISDDQFNPYVFITDLHKTRELEIRKFWSHSLSLPLEKISHVVYIKTVNKKVYENHDLYYGTLALRVKKSTYVKYDILALLERVRPT